jgi:putative methylase
MKQMEIVLSKFSDLDNPRPDLEQYLTPSYLAVDILFKALSEGDIQGRSVMELGCGPAPFAIGALILGASQVHAVDIDPMALEKAGVNLQMVIGAGLLDGGSSIHMIEGDISDVNLELPVVDTIIMNPPFGSQKRMADRPFIKAASDHAATVYSIHNGATVPFLEREWKKHGGRMDILERTSIEIPHRFRFHTRERSRAEVVVLKIIIEK